MTPRKVVGATMVAGSLAAILYGANLNVQGLQELNQLYEQQPKLHEFRLLENKEFSLRRDLQKPYDARGNELVEDGECAMLLEAYDQHKTVQRQIGDFIQRNPELVKSRDDLYSKANWPAMAYVSLPLFSLLIGGLLMATKGSPGV